MHCPTRADGRSWGRVSRASPVQTAVRNCTRDEGRSFEIGSQVLVSNHCKLLSSKAMAGVALQARALRLIPRHVCEYRWHCLRPSVVDPHVAAVGPAELLQHLRNAAILAFASGSSASTAPPISTPMRRARSPRCPTQQPERRRAGKSAINPALSSDHLVGAGQHRRRYCKAEHPVVWALMTSSTWTTARPVGPQASRP